VRITGKPGETSAVVSRDSSSLSWELTEVEGVQQPFVEENNGGTAADPNTVYAKVSSCPSSCAENIILLVVRRSYIT
jgi:hypothetical protein